jgi:hypothetical protein
MRMRSAWLSVVMVALGVMTDGARVLQAQQPATPRTPATPGGQGGGTIGGGVSRPTRPPQQPGQRPIRDPRQPAAEGTATVRGRVVDAATGAAIPRAKVRYNGRDTRSSRIASTDAEGVFTLTKIPAGSLTLSVEKATYIPTIHPERRRSMRPSNLMIGDGQTIDNITISMSRGGAITGRVFDAHGDPAENVMLQAVPTSSSTRTMFFNRGPRSGQGSNDIGEFRISRLEPGQYFLLASPQRRPGNQEDGSSANGRTFYPGVASIEQAQPITIERGQSLAGIDFQLLETTLTRITGFVTLANGAPARGGHVTARMVGGARGLPRGWGGFPSDGGGAGIAQGGTFDMTLQPGEYLLEAMAAQMEDGRPRGSFEMDRGQVRLTVSGEAMTGVTIPTGQGGTVSGRFVFKGESTPPTSFQGFNLGFTGPNGGDGGDECRAFNRPTVNADGTFTAENMWGTCQIRGGGTANGWTFESVMHNGNDITNRAVEFGNGRSISGVEIIYSDRVGEVAVTVMDDRGTPIQDYVTVLFPTEKEKWGDQRFLRTQVASPRTNLPANASPNYTNTRVSSSSLDPTPVVSNEVFPGAGGPSTMRNILAGDYFAVAVEDAAFEDLRDPEYLEQLSQSATRVTVAAGSSLPLQLRRLPRPQ